MQVKGNYTLDLPLSQVWDHILDRNILESVTPGVTELVELEPNQYEAISEIKLGPVRGSFKGNLLVHDIKELESFVLSLNQQSSIGSAQADIEVTLSPSDQKTEISYTGNANLTGVLGRLGQRVLGGVVNSLARQFFGDFEKTVKEIV